MSQGVPRGIFIVIDGIDGSGKTTQIRLLEQALKAQGHATQYIHFPQHGKASAALVDDYLAGKFGKLNPKATSIFYALDRFEAAPKIRAWLSEGVVVLADRYVTANAGHQGGKISDPQERLEFFEWLKNLEYEVFGIPKPDINIILHMPAMVALELVQQRNKQEVQDHVDVMHEANLEHLQLSEELYKQISNSFPNTHNVESYEGDSILPPEQIHKKIWEIAQSAFIR